MDHMPTRGIPCVLPMAECHWLPFLGLRTMPNTQIHKTVSTSGFLVLISLWVSIGVASKGREPLILGTSTGLVRFTNQQH